MRSSAERELERGGGPNRFTTGGVSLIAIYVMGVIGRSIQAFLGPFSLLFLHSTFDFILYDNYPQGGGSNNTRLIEGKFAPA